jgi:DNA polymerase-3 subunit epsilon
MREIIFDTETTGLDPASGDRVVEIGCLELLNSIPTGQTFHVYLDPQRDMPQEAFAIHGLSREFLTGKPLFAAIANDFMNFIGDARLVAHNAEFDMRFINAELARIGIPPIPYDRVVDTLALARRRHPGATNSLDALCARYRIDNSRRTKHGALLDSEILAEVYAELCGGRQTTLILASEVSVVQAQVEITSRGARPEPLPPTLSAIELDRHHDFVATLGDKALWHSFAAAPEPVAAAS